MFDNWILYCVILCCEVLWYDCHVQIIHKKISCHVTCKLFNLVKSN